MEKQECDSAAALCEGHFIDKDFRKIVIVEQRFSREPGRALSIGTMTHTCTLMQLNSTYIRLPIIKVGWLWRLQSVFAAVIALLSLALLLHCVVTVKTTKLLQVGRKRGAVAVLR